MTRADKFKAHCDTIVVTPSDITQHAIDLTAIIKNQIVQLCKTHYDLVADLSISEANYFLDYLGNSFYLKDMKEQEDDGLGVIMVSRLYQNVYYNPDTGDLESFIEYTNNNYDRMFLYSYLYKNIASRFNKTISSLPNIIDKVYQMIKNKEERERILNEEPEQEEEENLNPF